MRFEDIDFRAPAPPGGYDVPPALNLKCIVFTGALATAYWTLPTKNKYVLAALCVFPYLWLSYYDVAYRAQRHMGPTYLADFYDFAKVPNSKQVRVWKNWAPKWKARVHAVDALILVAVLALLPAFIDWKPKNLEVDEEARRKANAKAAIFIGACVTTCVYCRFKLRVRD